MRSWKKKTTGATVRDRCGLWLGAFFVLPLGVRVAHVGVRLVSGLMMRQGTGAVMLRGRALLLLLLQLVMVLGMDPRMIAPTTEGVVVRAAAIHQLPYFAILIGDVVGQFGFLEPCRGHALIPGAAAAAARRRVRRVQARLDQRLPRLGRDHRLQLPRRERVHVPRLRRHQQHHLRPRQRRQLVRLQRKNHPSIT